jgi:hypothetical protein
VHNEKEKPMATGADLIGNWSINGNGTPGWMTISSATDDGPVELRVSFSNLQREDRWAGNWSPDRREIILVRSLPGNQSQTYTGYLGDNAPGPLIFGGSFTQTDAAANKFGWYAEWQSWIIG